MKISLNSRKNMMRPDEPEKVYARSQQTKVMPFAEFAKHMALHDNKYKRGDIYAVTDLVTTHLLEYLLKGYKVELGAMGYFYASVSSLGADSAEEFTVDHIRDVKIVWEKPKEWVNLKENMEFEVVPTIEQQAQIKRLVRQGTLENLLDTAGDGTTDETPAPDGEDDSAVTPGGGSNNPDPNA